jgi:hypothetical protein
MLLIDGFDMITQKGRNYKLPCYASPICLPQSKNCQKLFRKDSLSSPATVQARSSATRTLPTTSFGYLEERTGTQTSMIL